MKASLFYVVMLTITLGLVWGIWDFKSGAIPVSDTEAMKEVPALPTIPGAQNFDIDKYEVTNGQYWRFDRSFEFPRGEEDYPATGITWYQARAYAEWANKRLPTAAEWEHAARATRKEFTLWDELEPQPIETNDSRYRVFRVGTFWRDKAPLGMMDMSGNAWEWTADTLRLADSTLAAIVKGGFTLKNGKLRFTDSAVSDTIPVNRKSPRIGFRCIRDK